MGSEGDRFFLQMLARLLRALFLIRPCLACEGEQTRTWLLAARGRIPSRTLASLKVPACKTPGCLKDWLLSPANA